MERFHWRQLILLIEIALLFAVGFIPNNLDWLANMLVSFVCAMQVQSFRKVHGNAYASTMCIGNMRQRYAVPVHRPAIQHMTALYCAAPCSILL